MQYKFIGTKHSVFNKKTQKSDQLVPGAIVELTDAQFLNFRDKFEPLWNSEGKEVVLRKDGPTIEAFVAKGYDPATYPPAGYAEVESEGFANFKEFGQLQKPAPKESEPVEPVEPGADGKPAVTK